MRRLGIPICLLAAGIGLIAVSVAADALGIGGEAGFGANQLKLAVVGASVVLLGVFLILPVGQKQMQKLQARIADAAIPVASLRVIQLAVWFGLLTGLIEACLRSGKIAILHHPIHLSAHLVWMSPVGEGVYFLLVGLILLVLARLWPKLFSLYMVVFVFSILAWCGGLHTLKWFHRIDVEARWVLLAGLAIVATRVVIAHRDGFLSFVGRTTLWMAILVVGLAAIVFSKESLAERRALAALPPAVANRSNVLFIVLDTVRAKSLSLYGYKRQTTPNLDRLAKNSVVFDQAISTAPWTLPAHASMFTGRYPHENTADWVIPLDDTYPTLAEVLSDHGYSTAGFVANWFNASRTQGIDRGFAHYDDYPVSLSMIVESSGLVRSTVKMLKPYVGSQQKIVRKTAAMVNKDFLRWLSGREDDRPFFVFLNYFDAHDPYVVPRPFEAKFSAPDAGRLPKMGGKRYQKGEVQKLQDAYDDCIAYLDHRLGLLFDQLQDQGLLDHTLVIITSDHGEQFFEHGLLGHSNSLYRTLLNIPLLISFPAQDVPQGVRITAPVTIRDLPLTVLDLLGIEEEGDFPGDSLVRYWNSGETPSDTQEPPLLSEVSQGINLPDHFPISKGDMKSITSGPMHYILNGDGIEELYDYIQDPWEQEDLARLETSQPDIHRMRASLQQLLQEDPPKP